MSRVILITDKGEIVALRSPVKMFRDLGVAGDEDGGIAGPSRCLPHGKINPTRLFHGRDYGSFPREKIETIISVTQHHNSGHYFHL